MATQLTPNFTLEELNPHGFPLSPTVLANLKRLANHLQFVRDFLGVPLKITSGYRSPEYNTKIGGAPNSLHMDGRAADVVPVGMSLQVAQEKLKNWPGGMGLNGAGFIHLDIRPNKERWDYTKQQSRRR